MTTRLIMGQIYLPQFWHSTLVPKLALSGKFSWKDLTSNFINLTIKVGNITSLHRGKKVNFATNIYCPTSVASPFSQSTNISETISYKISGEESYTITCRRHSLDLPIRLIFSSVSRYFPVGIRITTRIVFIQ